MRRIEPFDPELTTVLGTVRAAGWIRIHLSALFVRAHPSARTASTVLTVRPGAFVSVNLRGGTLVARSPMADLSVVDEWLGDAEAAVGPGEVGGVADVVWSV